MEIKISKAATYEVSSDPDLCKWWRQTGLEVFAACDHLNNGYCRLFNCPIEWDYIDITYRYNGRLMKKYKKYVAAKCQQCRDAEVVK